MALRYSPHHLFLRLRWSALQPHLVCQLQPLVTVFGPYADILLLLGSPRLVTVLHIPSCKHDSEEGSFPWPSGCTLTHTAEGCRWPSLLSGHPVGLCSNRCSQGHLDLFQQHCFPSLQLVLLQRVIPSHRQDLVLACAECARFLPVYFSNLVRFPSSSSSLQHTATKTADLHSVLLLVSLMKTQSSGLSTEPRGATPVTGWASAVFQPSRASPRHQ